MKFSGNNKFTGHKDTDRLILLNLNGKDLLSFCSSTPYLNNLCDEKLFKNKIKNTALEKVKLKYPYVKYRNFYAVMMYYIALLQEKYNYKYDLMSHNSGDPKVQYHLLQKYSHKKWILFTEASKAGELGLLKYAVATGVNIHQYNDEALKYSSMNGHLEMVKYLLKHGADVHMFNDEPLRWAAINGHLEVVKYLVEHGANMRPERGASIIHAAGYGHLEIVKYLVEHGADIHARDDKALIYAAKNGHLEIVKYLVEHGANIHAENDQALKAAFHNKHLSIAEYLKSLM